MAKKALKFDLYTQLYSVRSEVISIIIMIQMYIRLTRFALRMKKLYGCKTIYFGREYESFEKTIEGGTTEM